MFDHPMGIFEDYDFCDSEKHVRQEIDACRAWVKKASLDELKEALILNPDNGVFTVIIQTEIKNREAAAIQ